jgi:putative holliday junction resolvase
MIGRALGIDYGSKRVGLALSDPLRILASGAGVLPNSRSLISSLAEFIAEHEVVQVVVGMPYAPDGGAGKKGQEVEEFIQRLKGTVDVPIATWDESFTTVEASAAIRKGGMKKKQRQKKGVLDEMAARLLLQEYLDAHSRSDSPPHSPSLAREGGGG